MSLVKDKYNALAPRHEYLCDEVVLALAWKKASAYVRRHNWYADVLELDSSGLDLERSTQRWAAELASLEYRPRPARMVPAPKNARWNFGTEFPGGWGPVAPESLDRPATKPLALRPLAHLGIREQSVATAVMLCLADCVESAQGNPAVKAREALGKGVFSYGNRLYCHWSTDDRNARFSWGSADSYSRYFQDYQQFVARSREVAEALDRSDEKQGDRIYVVKLDLSSFFDGIDVTRLIAVLRNEYARFRQRNPSSPADDDPFWAMAQRALQFAWSPDDVGMASLLRDGVLPCGLPQGLMSSGFFANAYLLEFDRAMGRVCEQKKLIHAGALHVRLHDYCRYVDDLRLVVSADSTVDVSVIDEHLPRWVQSMLDKALEIGAGDDGGRLSLNLQKTEVELVSHVAGGTSVASRMRHVQHQLSGPFDMSSLEDLETALNGLLSMAESDATSSVPGRRGPVPALALVAKPPMDVRDDTLTRFAAFRLCKALRQRRMLTDLHEQRDGRTAGEVLLQDYELTARRLLGSWSENPSLVQVLRYAFDLFPSAELLGDVLDALSRKLQDAEQCPDQAAVAWYVLAELFRSAATETGLVAERDEGFAPGDIHEYRGMLAAYAENLLQGGGAPWFVQQQAALVLATVNSSTTQLSQASELARYRALHAYLKGTFDDDGAADADHLGVAIVGYQITGDSKEFVRWFKQFALNRGTGGARDALELVYRGSPGLFDVITSPGKGARAASQGLLSRDLAQHVDARWKHGSEPLREGTWLPLSSVTTHPTRPFVQENALVRLGVALTELPAASWNGKDVESVFDLEVRCSSWKQVNDPNGAPIELRVARGPRSEDSRLFRTPTWCKPELAWMYAIGSVLRAAAVGSNDFTVGWRLGVEEPGWYRGIPSTTARRRLGMLHTSRALGGSTSAVTPWFSGLLGVLLRWPGIASEGNDDDTEQVGSVEELRAKLVDRLTVQRSLFGRSSGSPIYRYPVLWEIGERRSLRVAVVQGLLPSFGDFGRVGLDGMDRAPYRARHRNHTAALLRLTSKKLGAYESLLGKPHRPMVDLVVLPEYSIHVDDQDLLRAFSDETGAMLHYGLLGARHPISGGHTNSARWLIPIRTDRRRSWIEVDQGKLHLTEDERTLSVSMWCPYRVVVDLRIDALAGYRLVGAICYDATDLSLAADLKNESHMFVVPALNKDVKTFDSMVSALRYHMYQHVVICNTGEFGGSSAQAPYDEEHRRVISHSHGSGQIAVAVFDIPVDDFGPALRATDAPVEVKVKRRLGKTPPAGLDRRR